VDADRASSLRLAGLARAARFSWARVARETLSVYRRAAEPRPRPVARRAESPSP
jgi:hypothetical protein